MENKITVVLRYTNETAFLNRMASIGLAERVFEEGRGSPLMRFGEVNTSVKADEDTGENYLTILLNKSDADKFPPSNNPAFALIWRSDECELGGPDHFPWPTYSVEDRDEGGVGLGTFHQQGVGGIA
jgi:hypothetical protein